MPVWSSFKGAMHADPLVAATTSLTRSARTALRIGVSCRAPTVHLERYYRLPQCISSPASTKSNAFLPPITFTSCLACLSSALGP